MREPISRRGAVKVAALGAAVGAALAAGSAPAAAQGFGPEGAWVVRWQARDRFRVLPQAEPLLGRPGPRFESLGIGHWGYLPDGTVALTVFASLSAADGSPVGYETWSATFLYDPLTDTLAGRHRWTEFGLDGHVIDTSSSTNLQATRVRIEPVL
jgi:hypothetical protein